MARRDEDGYYHLVDRKSNMIISGGENIYPSEVEGVLGAHPEGEGRRGHRRARRQVGRGGARGGRAARRRGGDRGARSLDWCRDKIAGYKRPRSIAFIADDEMPRTATGKILHRVLRERL